MEDNEILALLWERKEQALSELERKYGTRLKLLACRMVSEEDAEEWGCKKTPLRKNR